jgi:tetratricopeptide (TPR) repeat protein
MRTPLLTAVLAAGLLAAPSVTIATAPPALAKDAGLTFFEAEYKKMAKSAAKKLWGVAKDAKKLNLHGFAVETAAYALDFDPNQKDARDYLCYRKKGDGWERDEDAYAKLGKQNLKNQKESQATFDKKVEKWRKARDKVNQFVADKYVQIGNACKAKGFDEQATKSFERALLIDPQNDGANKGVGRVKVGMLWMTKEKVAAIEKAAGGEWLTSDTEYQDGVGVKLHAIESPHFRLFDDGDKAVLKEHIKALETLYVFFLADVGIDPTTDVFGGKKVDLVVVSDQPQWEKWVDQFSNSADPQWTKESTTSRSYYLLRGGVKRVETAEHIDTRDPLLHHAAHFIGQAVWKSRHHAWLDEGLAYYYTVRIQDTTRTSCLDKNVTGYGNNQEVIGGDKDWAQSERWRDYLRQIVKAKADTELRKILMTPLATLKLPDSVKAWAFVSWLMEKEREQFIRFLEALRDDPELDQEKTFQELFGKGIEDIDNAWRDYALRAF